MRHTSTTTDPPTPTMMRGTAIVIVLGPTYMRRTTTIRTACATLTIICTRQPTSASRRLYKLVLRHSRQLRLCRSCLLCARLHDRATAWDGGRMVHERPAGHAYSTNGAPSLRGLTRAVSP